MKLLVIVPSGQYLSQAGTRIRYQRIKEPLARHGWSLELVPIDECPEFSAGKVDACLFSKCQDARAIGLAEEARAASIPVGVDLFDDYFSQLRDSRFAQQRNWLRSMAERVSFFLCSTPRMHTVGTSYCGGIPGHVLNDPFMSLQPKRLAGELERKRAQALEQGILRVLWFGMGDNPNFSVGLHDLVAFSEHLQALEGDGLKVELTILTNLRALDVDGLARLRRLPVQFTIAEWTERLEIEALAQNLVSFMPVNAQSFSNAKSLNRGVSALTGGTQVLSVGYPLYEPLNEFVYRDAQQFLSHLRTGTMRFGGRNMDAFAKRLGQLSHPDREAGDLATFLTGLAKPAPAEPTSRPPIAILHGAKTTGGIHKFAQQRNWLSLGTPLTPAGGHYDAHFGYFGDARELALRLSNRARDRLPDALRKQVTAAAKEMGKGPGLMLPLSALQIPKPMACLGTILPGTSADRATLDGAIGNHARQLFGRLFGALCFIPSELDAAVNLASASEAGPGVCA